MNFFKKLNARKMSYKIVAFPREVELRINEVLKKNGFSFDDLVYASIIKMVSELKDYEN